jgi:hypothetical protein
LHAAAELQDKTARLASTPPAADDGAPSLEVLLARLDALRMGEQTE